MKYTLGESFENVARMGLSLQRSQTLGRIRKVEGSFVRYYRRVETRIDAPSRESSFFDGIDLAATLPGLDDALAAFDPAAPERIVPLTRRPVTRMEAQLPFGYVERELVVMPFACATAYWPVARIWRARETRSSAPPGAPSGPREVMTSVPLSTLSR